MMGLEAHLQAEILVRWGAHPRVRVWRQNTGAARIKGRLVRFGVPGCPDILGIIGPEGRMLGIEVKAPDGVQSDDQKRFERVFGSMGAVYVLARSVEDVDRAFAAIGLTR